MTFCEGVEACSMHSSVWVDSDILIPWLLHPFALSHLCASDRLVEAQKCFGLCGEGNSFFLILLNSGQCLCSEVNFKAHGI
jgi:hypothetical protein